MAAKKKSAAAAAARLRVAEAPRLPVGSGHVMVDSRAMEAAGWSTGQILEIRHSRTTYAKACPGGAEDDGEGNIRIDGMTRQNLGAGIGDRVSARAAAAVADAERVVLTPVGSTYLRAAEEPTDAAAARARFYLLGRVLVEGDAVSLSSYGRPAYTVTKTTPAGLPAMAGYSTTFEIAQAAGSKHRPAPHQSRRPEPTEGGKGRIDAVLPRASYKDIGGLGAEVRKIREMVELPMLHPEILEKLGVEAPKGVLLHGPPGTGKTLLARAVAGETSAHFMPVSGPEILRRYRGEGEERLREVFRQAEERAPSIVFIDEIDSIATMRYAALHPYRSLIAQLLTLMDGIRGRGKVVVIAEAGRPDSIAPALRRPGRLDREIEIGVPDSGGREQILAIHTRSMPLAPSVDLAKIAGEAHGFSGADLEALAKEAAMRALRRVTSRAGPGGSRITARALGRIRVTADDFRDALREVRPSVLPRARAAQAAPRARAAQAAPRIGWGDIGGLGAEVRKIREMVELPMLHPEILEKLGVEAPKGVLLHGPPGTGKTLLARAVAGETSAHFMPVSGPEIMGKYRGEGEEYLREVFRQAEERAPSIVFIDEIDVLAPKRADIPPHLARLVAQLLTLMDGIRGRGKVVVIAATNRPDSIDPALRRPGRLDREIEIGVPDSGGREETLGIHTRSMPLAPSVDLAKIAGEAHGFSGADLEALAKEAAMRALRRVTSRAGPGGSRITARALGRIRVTADDFRDALREVRPSALREVLVQAPRTGWGDIGGLEELKEEVRRAVEWPLRHGPAMAHVGARAPKGILLHGPPGTGKTLLARAAAGMSGSNFISIKGPELLSKWVGESEKGVREVFRKARQAAPCIVFFDEVDALVPQRRSGGDAGSRVMESVVSQILTEIDGLEELSDVLVIGATNRLDIVDPALLRPGRFDRVVEVPLPDADARRSILLIHMRNRPFVDVELDALVEQTVGMSGAEIEGAVDRAAAAALERHIDGRDPPDYRNIKITREDVSAAMGQGKDNARQPQFPPGVG